ncbi:MULTISPECIES: serine/threonine-protein kinase [unclassified Streptomyces]|uniref:serine/threonine-protein kinase n=1 Tax=unclassified Streptomyces TaxID=2593676 RepID=UPI002E2FF24E|nr:MULTISPECIES: protein kinase [unclassified Streptomyces]
MGEVFAGRYELVDPIGHGGVGAVWRAWDRRRRRYVAAKVLRQSDAHALLRFVREQALRIDHPHVLAPASWAADDDKVLFTMDLVAGGSLVHLVSDYGPLPPAFVCTLLDQLLSGLAAVHAEGVVHRDIKPANVLLEATGTARPRLRLSDFGIAMRLGEPRLTETDYVVGTPGYLAPEQMMGSEPDFPADLFAVGLVALYLLEGAKPDTKALIEYFVENGTPSAPQGMPEPLWQVVATLLQPDPAARFRTATGARKALAAAAELLPEPGPDDELVEVFDQVGPLPTGFDPTGPAGTATRPTAESTASGRTDTGSTASQSTATGSPGAFSGPASGRGTDPARGAAPGQGFTPSQVPDPAQAPGSGPDPGAAAGPGSLPGPDTGSGPDADGGAGGDGWPGTTSRGVLRGPGPEAARPEPDTGDAHPEAAPGDVPPPPAPDFVPPESTDPDSAPPRPSTMSDTGSFHLPPPRAATPHAPTRPHHQPQAQPQPQRQPEPRSPGHPRQPDQPQPHPQPQQAWHETQRHPVPGHPWRPPEQPPTPPTAVTVPHTAPVYAQPFGPPSVPAPAPQRPVEPTVVEHRHAHGSAGSHRAVHRRAVRPGPPARVAVPVLLLALACLAVGFWALTRI